MLVFGYVKSVYKTSGVYFEVLLGCGTGVHAVFLMFIYTAALSTTLMP